LDIHLADVDVTTQSVKQEGKQSIKQASKVQVEILWEERRGARESNNKQMKL